MPLNVGVGSVEGAASFTSGKDTTNHVLASRDRDPDAIDVRMCTLDSALEGESPAVVKIDVEGYETLVLEGAQKTLSKASLHSVIMELNGCGSRYGYDESGILRMMSDHDFKTYSYDPLNRSLIKLNGKSLTSGNTLYSSATSP